MLFTVFQGVVPSVVVGVVGIGHVEGITDNWDKEIDVKELLRYKKHICLVVVIDGLLLFTCGVFVSLLQFWYN